MEVEDDDEHLKSESPNFLNENLVYFQKSDPLALSTLRRVLYHELAHYLEDRFLTFGGAFHCKPYQPLTPALIQQSLCFDECRQEFSAEEVASAFTDLSQTSHISFYSLTSQTEDFADLASYSLLLTPADAQAFFTFNDVKIYDFKEAVSSQRLAQKMRVVNMLLDPPFDDQNDADSLRYESITCTGRFGPL